MAEDISNDLKTNDELLHEIVEDQEAKLSNQQNKHEYELKQNKRRLEEYERSIRELQEKLQAIDEKTSANLSQFDEEGERFDKAEKKKLSLLHQRLSDDDNGYYDTLRRKLLDTYNDKFRLEEQNKKLLNDLHETRQMVASMKKGSKSGYKVDAEAGVQDLIMSLQTKLSMETAKSKKLNDVIEELHQRIESLQKQSEKRETASNETTEETVNSGETEVQIDHPIKS
uniref:Uncharacterized protein n=1 Tax=Amphimedon queenslandica TaxID=400682 RepID=A0A1X7SFJ0_AMPQE